MKDDTREVNLNMEVFFNVFVFTYHCYYTWTTLLHFSILTRAYLKTFTSY